VAGRFHQRLGTNSGTAQSSSELSTSNSGRRRSEADLLDGGSCRRKPIIGERHLPADRRDA
jgi:hypothetical protein